MWKKSALRIEAAAVSLQSDVSLLSLRAEIKYTRAQEVSQILAFYMLSHRDASALSSIEKSIKLRHFLPHNKCESFRGLREEGEEVAGGLAPLGHLNPLHLVRKGCMHFGYLSCSVCCVHTVVVFKHSFEVSSLSLDNFS